MDPRSYKRYAKQLKLPCPPLLILYTVCKGRATGVKIKHFARTSEILASFVGNILPTYVLRDV